MSALDDNLNVPVLGLIAAYAQGAYKPLKKTADDDNSSREAINARIREARSRDWDRVTGRGGRESKKNETFLPNAWKSTAQTGEASYPEGYTVNIDGPPSTNAENTSLTGRLLNPEEYTEILNPSSLSYMKAAYRDNDDLTRQMLQLVRSVPTPEFQQALQASGVDAGKVAKGYGTALSYLRSTMDPDELDAAGKEFYNTYVANPLVGFLKNRDALRNSGTEQLGSAIVQDGMSVAQHVIASTGDIAKNEGVDSDSYVLETDKAAQVAQADTPPRAPEVVEAAQRESGGTARYAEDAEALQQSRGRNTVKNTLTSKRDEIAGTSSTSWTEEEITESTNLAEGATNQAIEEVQAREDAPQGAKFWKAVETRAKDIYGNQVLALRGDELESWKTPEEDPNQLDDLDEATDKAIKDQLDEGGPVNLAGYGDRLNFSGDTERDRPWAGSNPILPENRLQSIAERYSGGGKAAAANRPRKRIEGAARAEAEAVIGGYENLTTQLGKATERRDSIDAHLKKMEEAGYDSKTNERMRGLETIRNDLNRSVNSLNQQKKHAERWMESVAIDPDDILNNQEGDRSRLIDQASEARRNDLAEQYNESVPEWSDRGVDFSQEESTDTFDPWKEKAGNVRRQYDAIKALEDKYGSRQQMGPQVLSEYDARVKGLHSGMRNMIEAGAAEAGSKKQSSDNPAYVAISKAFGDTGDPLSDQSDMTRQRLSDLSDIYRKEGGADYAGTGYKPVQTTPVGRGDRRTTSPSDRRVTQNRNIDGNPNIELRQKVRARQAELNKERRVRNANEYTQRALNEGGRASSLSLNTRAGLTSTSNLQNPALAEQQTVNNAVTNRNQAAEKLRRPGKSGYPDIQRPGAMPA